MPDSQLTKPKSIEEIKKTFKDCSLGFDPEYVLKQADEETKDLKGLKEFAPDTNFYKAMTVFEFDKGILLTSAIPERFKVFALEFNKNLQVEYNCVTSSERSMAELVTLNFVRTLAIQNKINSCLSMNSIGETGVKFLAVMSKELDRAEKHYITSLAALKSFKMPSMAVNIKTNTAVVGQNQIVQSNNS
jgi:hypothetical protein